MKRMLAIGATLLLCACGHQNVRTPVPLGQLVVPGATPWLQVSGGPDKLEVRGLDEKLTLEPAPGLSEALQSQLGQALRPDYFAQLTVSCDALDVGMSVNQKKAPGLVAMDLSVRCVSNVLGRVTTRAYEAKPTAAVAAGSGDAAYAQALPTLLASGAQDLAAQLRTDILTSKSKLK